MKRTDDLVDLTLYAALFKDIEAWAFGLRHALVADYQRLERTVTTRGVSFIMIDMPDAGRLVDRALSSGHLAMSRLPKTFGKTINGGYREFLYCLFSEVFDRRGYVRPCVQPTAIFFLRQVLYLAKKARKDCSDAAILAEVDSFRLVDASLREPYLNWADDSLSFGERLSFIDGYRETPDLISHRDGCPKSLLRLLDEVGDRISSRFPILDWRDIKPKHGPGAVSDARSGADKYLFPTWPTKLDGTFPSTYFAQSREDLHLEVPQVSSLNEPPSRLIAVPKTLKGPRLIASEPTSHQFLQLGLMQWFRKYLPTPLRPCIDFLDQTPSQEFCLRASTSDEYATVDLTAASDRLSCWVVERFFRSNPTVIIGLHACRTRWLKNHTGVGEPFFIKLRKFAPMGSGVTFPVQSICYAGMAIAAILYERKWKVTTHNLTRAARELQVFGDDIILPSSAVQALTLLMTHVGLKVSASKTHYSGRFRESCGMDAYDGVDVTPGYLRDLGLRDTADGLVAWIDVSNNMYSKGLWCLANHMVQLVPAEIRRLIPVSVEQLGCLTLQSFQATPMVGKVRINAHLHRPEVLGLCVEVKSDRQQRESHQSLLQYFLEEPDPESKWSAGYLVKNRIRLRKRWVPYSAKAS